MLLLHEDDVRRVLSMDDALTAVETSFRQGAQPGSSNMLRRRMFLDTTRFNILGGALAPMGRAAVKVYAGGGGFWLLLFDGAGTLLATISFRHASLFRTGAATGVATRWLSREDSTSVGILGTGRQATAQLAAIARVRPVEVIRAWSPTPSNVADFATRMTEELGVEVVPVVGPEEAVRGMDIVVTATKAYDPVLSGEWLAPGAHVNLIGANQPHRREAYESVFGCSDLITVDDLAQAEVESGDIMAAIDAKVVRWHDVVEFHDVISGKVAGRTSRRQVTVFKSLGIGMEDVAVASFVYDRALRAGVGVDG